MEGLGFHSIYMYIHVSLLPLPDELLANTRGSIRDCHTFIYFHDDLVVVKADHQSPK